MFLIDGKFISPSATFLFGVSKEGLLLVRIKRKALIIISSKIRHFFLKRKMNKIMSSQKLHKGKIIITRPQKWLQLQKILLTLAKHCKQNIYFI